MSDHPTPFALEAYRVDPSDPALTAHLDTCEECRGYLDDLGQHQRGFLADEGVDQFLSRPGIAAELSRPLEPDKPGKRAFLWWFLLPAAGMIAAMTAVVLLPGPDVLPPGTTSEDVIRMKGTPAAVVRLRQGKQTRVSGDVAIRPGDQLRVEVTLQKPRVLAVALIADNGEVMWLLREGSFEAGVHYPHDDAVTVTDPDTRGRLLIGRPGAVQQAVRTREYGGVRVIRLVPDQGGVRR